MSHSRLRLKPVAVKHWEQHIWVRSSREFFPFVVRTCEGDKGDSLFSRFWKLCIISLWRRFLNFPSLKTSRLTDFLFPWAYSWWPWWEVIPHDGCEVVGRLFTFQYPGDTMSIRSHQSIAWFGLAILEFGSGELNSASQKHQGLQPGLAVVGSLFSESWVSLPDFKSLDFIFFFFYFSSSYIVDYLEASRVQKVSL